MDDVTHDKAWNLLKERGFKLGEMIMIRSHFADIFKNEYPNINIEYKKGDVIHYYSNIDEISSLRFNNKNEVILANAIYENVKNNFNMNDFIQYIKFVFRIIGLDSIWCK